MDISIVPSKQSSTKAGKWQAYVDDALLLTGQVTKAGIYGLDGLQWAASSDFKVHACTDIYDSVTIQCTI